jgi:hypothetical protein
MALNFYEILEIAREATPEQVKAAFRRLARKWHPDRHADEKFKLEATRQMQRINAANDVLKDEEKRRQYDAHLQNPRVYKSPTRAKSQTSAPAEPTKPRRQTANPRPAPPPRAAAPTAPPNPEQQRQSAARHERANIAVKTYFDELMESHPAHKSRLQATLRWQLNKKNTAVRKGLEAGHSEVAALSRWAQAAKRAGDNQVKPPSWTQTPPPRDPQTPVSPPRNVETTPLDETVVASVRFYYDELIGKNPLDKGPLQAALHWQLTRKRGEIAALIRAGQSEENALWRWAYEAKRAADERIKKR